jgi:hypothetical protein
MAACGLATQLQQQRPLAHLPAYAAHDFSSALRWPTCTPLQPRTAVQGLSFDLTATSTG